MIKRVEPPSIGPNLALLRRLIVAASLVLAALHPAAALDAVSMQSISVRGLLSGA
jgi:hypothetical protein